MELRNEVADLGFETVLLFTSISGQYDAANFNIANRMEHIILILVL
jgi:hypothetical protein